ncbi:matrixin family metalloprotease [Streptomyces siamensis]|uniref:Peptidase metallopeptidase domain-containing protein n=1 Tax=Streptomyces siamensis TaxID=1274986 RepID=A0ABP9JBZ1_9ACTN
MTARSGPDPNRSLVGASASDAKLAENYLRAFGYLPEDVPLQSDSGRAAVRASQAMALLATTGDIDEATRTVFEQPRCGFPDRQGVEDPRSGKSLTSVAEFVAFGTVWDHAVITYRINNLSPDFDQNRQRALIRAAWERWAAVVPLVFQETTGAPDIEIRFARGSHGDGSPFDGPGNILAHAFFPPPNGGSLAGDAHFDEDEQWQDGVRPGGFDLFNVAVHEFGHSLGLNHTSVPNSTMNPFYPVPSTPAADDREGVRQIYRRHIWAASLYRDVLGRRFDDGGLDFWVRKLFSNSSPEQVARGFLYSLENSGRIATDLYFTLLDRAPEPAGLDHWRTQLAGGLGRQSAIVAFLDSAEYRGKYPADDAFIDSLYRRLLRRPPDAGGYRYWKDMMKGGMSRYEVARGFVLSDEYCRAYARGLYRNYLRREPEQAGWDGWTGRLKAGLNHQDAETGFVASPEYQNAVVSWW